MEISVKHIIIIVLLRLIAVFGFILCDLSHERCDMGWFDECKMMLLIQKNCSKVQQYSTKTPGIRGAQLAEYTGYTGYIGYIELTVYRIYRVHWAKIVRYTR